METLISLSKSINKHLNRSAFYINEKYYTYLDLAQSISKIRLAIQNNAKVSEKHIGLIANDDLDTYAAIIAIWFESKAFIPLSLDNPKSRNETIIDHSEIFTIVDTSENSIFPEKNIINPTKILKINEINLSPKTVEDDDTCIILFTSGTTGIPKGVPLTYYGISTCINDFQETMIDIDENDRSLLMFEITFDAAITTFLVSILNGACIYTVPKNESTFSSVFELLENHNLTLMMVVPTFLSYLRPYFEEINLPAIKNCMLGGESLSEELTEEWSHCVPNAKIINAYGLTETTIQSTNYVYKQKGKNKSHNGILSIGKAQPSSSVIIVDEHNNILSAGIKGELCIGGPQLTPGYLKDEKRNKETFVYIDYKGVPTRFYKTGDLCFMDEDGDIFFLGRLDFQAKIQGFRVELSEVEYHANTFLNKINTVALAVVNKFGNTDLGLAIESDEFVTKELTDYLKTKMPPYMIPAHFKIVKEFPLNINGKTDRMALRERFTF